MGDKEWHTGGAQGLSDIRMNVGCGPICIVLAVLDTDCCHRMSRCRECEFFLLCDLKALLSFLADPSCLFPQVVGI